MAWGENRDRERDRDQEAQCTVRVRPRQAKGTPKTDTIKKQREPWPGSLVG